MSNKLSNETIQQIRKANNRDLIRRMKNGDPLIRYDSKASWFPPRPKIEKDPKAIEQLYGKTKDKIEKKETAKKKQKKLSLITT